LGGILETLKVLPIIELEEGVRTRISKSGSNGQNTRVARRSIRAVVKRIAEQFDPERIILFGSYAYGRPHPDSDVDLLVVLATNERARAKQIEIARTLSPHPFGMDILVRTPEQLRERIALGDYFLREIVTKGQVLYERPRR
jgi:predicted nucleotidyltransferase